MLAIAARLVGRKLGRRNINQSTDIMLLVLPSFTYVVQGFSYQRSSVYEIHVYTILWIPYIWWFQINIHSYLLSDRHKIKALLFISIVNVLYLIKEMVFFLLFIFLLDAGINSASKISHLYVFLFTFYITNENIKLSMAIRIFKWMLIRWCHIFSYNKMASLVK